MRFISRATLLSLILRFCILPIAFPSEAALIDEGGPQEKYLVAALQSLVIAHREYCDGGNVHRPFPTFGEFKKLRKTSSFSRRVSPDPDKWHEIMSSIADNPSSPHEGYIFLAPQPSDLPDKFYSGIPFGESNCYKTIIFLATPAQYGESGRYTFCMNSMFTLVKKDMGKNTLSVGDFGEEAPYDFETGWLDPMGSSLASYLAVPAIEKTLSQDSLAFYNESFIFKKIRPAYDEAQGHFNTRGYERKMVNGAYWRHYADKLHKLGRYSPPGSDKTINVGLFPENLIQATSPQHPYMGYMFIEPENELSFEENPGNPINWTNDYCLIATPVSYGETGRMTFCFFLGGVCSTDIGKTISKLDEVQDIPRDKWRPLPPNWYDPD